MRERSRTSGAFYTIGCASLAHWKALPAESASTGLLSSSSVVPDPWLRVFYFWCALL